MHTKDMKRRTSPKVKLVRTNLSLPPDIMQKARLLAAPLRGNVSLLVEHLILDRERMNGKEAAA
jgi:hypothetical protein